MRVKSRGSGSSGRRLGLNGDRAECDGRFGRSGGSLCRCIGFDAGLQVRVASSRTRRRRAREISQLDSTRPDPTAIPPDSPLNMVAPYLGDGPSSDVFGPLPTTNRPPTAGAGPPAHQLERLGLDSDGPADGGDDDGACDDDDLFEATQTGPATQPQSLPNGTPQGEAIDHCPSPLSRSSLLWSSPRLTCALPPPRASASLRGPPRPHQPAEHGPAPALLHQGRLPRRPQRRLRLCL